ncbi:MAG: ATP-binding cassette domain-containing protein [Gemmatimonadaceae bacterium]
MPELLLQLDDVGKTFGAGFGGAREPVVALDGVSAGVHAGEIVGVAGTHGAGKSTLLRIAAGLLRPDRGAVRWRGALPLPRDAAAYIPADVAMHAFLSVREALRFAAVQRELRDKPRRVAEDLWAARLDLSSRFDRRVGELSLAERRVVAIAAALQGVPELLVLDGVLDGLDPASRREVRRVLHILAASGLGVLVAAADLGLLTAVAHRGALLRAGRIVAWIDPRHAAPTAALELAVGAPRTAAARLRRHVAAACRRDGAVRVPLADRSAEDVLALCRAEGIRVLRSRVVTETPGRWTVPPTSG